MPPTPPVIGVIGKTNVGKSTFFSAATMVPARIENRPFVTIEPNIGVAYVRTICPHVDLGLPKCDPRNSLCVEGFRFIPVKLLDVAGLVKGAHEGRGLGNKFMDDLRQADVLIHVVDMSGSTDEEGNPVPPGTHDPLEDILLIEEEVDEWFFSVIRKDWERFARGLDNLPLDDVISSIAQRVSGLSIRREHVAKALRETGLDRKKPSSWSVDELRGFIMRLRKLSKPILILANKMDIPEARVNFERVKEALPDRVIIPASSVFELALKKAWKGGYVHYIPGDSSFSVLKPNELNEKQRKALDRISSFMKEFGGTGVQEALNRAVFELLKMIVVYPVEDPHKYTDGYGNVLPDAYLVREGTTAEELAYLIHTDLGKGFLYAVLAREGKRVGGSYILKDGDIVKVVSAKASRH
ncbi:MAG: redox-regulated ATPase YchF [Desulfurococcales archaeon]|nr:redox-regulated ATPase YchF [Desulfurococcales archaeon]